jgi:Dienelactone hydrolase family
MTDPSIANGSSLEQSGLPPAITQFEIDQRVFDLYDEYCHGRIDRREFVQRAGALTVGGVSALAMAQALLPRYAQAQTISFTDARMKGQYVTYPSPGGNSGTMRGYLVRPTGQGPFPAVLVIHENRGLNPYIEDVARRAAVEGFLALAPDGLSPVGGYPATTTTAAPFRALSTRESCAPTWSTARVFCSRTLCPAASSGSRASAGAGAPPTSWR